ncbi:MAG: nitroreductase family protein [Thermoplasmata archaeon]|nr:nitroreductase family protein [Thermoplasmata archaeon]
MDGMQEPMELMDAILRRRSVRKYQEKDVPEETVKNLVEIGNLAPSAGNLQARDFIVVRDKKTKEALAKASLNQEFVAEAPVNIVICTNEKKIKRYGTRGTTLYTYQDTAASAMLIMLAALEHGLGTCWVGAFDEEAVRQILQIPSYARPVIIIPLGYPAEQPAMRKRAPLEEYLHAERW